MSHTIGQAKQDKQSNFNSNQPSQDTPKSDAISSAPNSGLSDTDYEFLFNQLLEGISHGWHDRRIVKFFHQLGDRGSQADWVAWLERLRSKLLKLPVQSKRHLGTMMIRLGELTQSASEVNQIGGASHRIGRELLFGNVTVEIWEYAGPDLLFNSQSIENERELSERLPSDFSALSTGQVTEAATNSDREALPAPENVTTQKQVVEPAKSTASEKIDSDRSLEATEASKVVDSQSDLWHSEPELPLENDNTASAPDITDSSVLETTSEREIASESKAVTVNLEKNTELDLDLNRSQESGESDEFEFEPDISSTVDEEDITTENLVRPENISTVSSQAHSPSEQLSAPNLSAALKAFESEAKPQPNYASEPPQVPAREEAELVQLDQQIAASQNSLTEEQSSGSAIADIDVLGTKELDDSSLEVIESWFNLGLKQVSAGEYAKAIVSWDKALTIDSNLSEAWHNRGSALGRLGNYDAAVKSFENALKIDPDNYQAWNDRAHALYQLQNWSEAIESWSQAIKIVPGNHLLWYNRGCALEQLSQWDDAIASYEKALEIKPDFKPGRSRYINLVADDSRPN